MLYKVDWLPSVVVIVCVCECAIKLFADDILYLCCSTFDTTKDCLALLDGFSAVVSWLNRCS